MMSLSKLTLAFGLLLSLANTPAALGQQSGTVPDGAPALEQKGQSSWSSTKGAEAGPQVFLADETGQLGVLDLSNGNVRLIGRRGVVLTDIAFAPGGRLFGISFTTFYRVNPSTGVRTTIGSLGVSGMNALACPTAQQCLAAAFNNTTLYKINTTSGKATAIGSNGSFRSAGDLVFFQDSLYLSSTNRRFVKLNAATGRAISSASHGIVDLWGLIALRDGLFFGFSNTEAFQFNPANGARSRLGDFGGQGLGKTNGAAFNGYFRG